MEEANFLYEKVAGDLAGVIQAGTIRPGERIPSVRELSRQRGISITTVMQAYRLLEDQGFIEVRPQSGYYVRKRPHAGLAAPKIDTHSVVDATRVDVNKIVLMINRDMWDPKLVQFGGAIPNPDLLPTTRLNRILAARSRQKDYLHNICGIPQGIEELRGQVARRSLNFGCQFTIDDLLITSGCTEAISLSLRVVCRPGDTVAIESPTYFNILQTLESQGLRALEIPTHPDTGVSLDALRFAIEHHTIRACLFVPNFNNPLGSLMPDAHKQELVELLAEHDIPLIEDDIHGELYYTGQRPKVAKSYDRKGLVLTCSSFSKDISPSYRVGWIAPGRFKDELIRAKMATNMGTAILPQQAIAEYLSTNGYDHHMRRVRQEYAQKIACMSQVILKEFPAGTRVSSPVGGFVIWVQLPEQVDALELYGMALKAGITLVPGHVFSPTPKYRNYIRLNAAYWSDKNSWAIRRIGELADRLAAKG